MSEPTPAPHLGAALARLRLAAGTSVDELSVRLDVQGRFVERAEAGQVDLRWSVVTQWLSALQVSTRELAEALLATISEQ